MMIEEHPLALAAKTSIYELRQVESTLVAETRIEGSFDEAANRGTRILGDYISGGNASRTKGVPGAYAGQSAPSEKIARTAPVNLVQTPWGLLVQFTMPAGFTLTSRPKPNDERVHLRVVPPRRIAVIRYSGSWSEGNYLKHRRELITALKQDGVPATGEATFARFDSAFQPWFLRRNEAWIEVQP